MALTPFFKVVLGAILVLLLAGIGICSLALAIKNSDSHELRPPISEPLAPTAVPTTPAVVTATPTTTPAAPTAVPTMPASKSGGRSGTLDCVGECRQKGAVWKETYSDLSASVTFINPTQRDDFEYGFEIKTYLTAFGDFTSRDSISVIVDSEKSWMATDWVSRPLGDGYHHLTPELIDSGRLPSTFDVGSPGRNHLRLTAIDDEACLFVNYQRVSCFALPGHGAEWYTGVIAGIGDTSYENWTVEPVPK